MSGGVAKAVVNCINELYPGHEVKVASAQGLAECRKMMQLAKAGKYNGYLLEGMACPGGCVAGAGHHAADQQIDGRGEYVRQKGGGGIRHDHRISARA